MDLQIKYFGKKINAKLDKKIERFFGTLGYEWHSHRYSSIGNYREIVFDRKK